MTALSQGLLSIANAISRGLDRLSNAIAFYVIPLAIALVSFAALFIWQDLYRSASEVQLELRVLEPTAAQLTVEEARNRLATAPTSSFYKTNLSELPIWFGFEIPDRGSSPQPRLI